MIVAVVAAVAGAVFAALALSGGGSERRALTVPELSAAAIDPATGQVVDVVPLQDPPDAALTVGHTVWVASWASHTLTRLDDRTEKGSPPSACRHPLALAYGAGRIWIASPDRRCSLMAVDPRSGDVKGQWPLHQPGLGVFSSQGWGANGIAFARNSVWATVGVSGLVRVSPAIPASSSTTSSSAPTPGRSPSRKGPYG